MAVNFVIKELPSSGFIGVLFVFTGGLTESLRLSLQNVVPAFAVCRSFDEGSGFGGVGGAELLVVPLDFLCDNPNLERLGYFRASLRDEAEVLSLQNTIPTLAICWSLDEGGGLGGVGGAEVLVIPFDFLSGTVSDVAEVIGFGGPT
jgi:hypothetical protein